MDVVFNPSPHDFHQPSLDIDLAELRKLQESGQLPKGIEYLLNPKLSSDLTPGEARIAHEEGEAAFRLLMIRNKYFPDLPLLTLFGPPPNGKTPISGPLSLPRVDLVQHSAGKDGDLELLLPEFKALQVDLYPFETALNDSLNEALLFLKGRGARLGEFIKGVREILANTEIHPEKIGIREFLQEAPRLAAFIKMLSRAIAIQSNDKSVQSAGFTTECVLRMLKNGMPLEATSGFIEAVDRKIITLPEESIRILGERAAHWTLSMELRAHGEFARVDDSVYESVGGVPLMTSPSANGSAMGRALHSDAIEVLSTFERLFQLNEGFHALEYAARRPDKGSLSGLTKMGLELGQTWSLECDSRDNFPGPGVIIRFDRPEERIFYSNDRTLSDPYALYKAKWPQYRNSFQHLSEATFIFTRGFVAVSVPDSKELELEDRYGHSKNYSLVVFNHHFQDYGSNVAMLIPTDILFSKLMPSVASPLVELNGTRRSLHEGKLAPADLLDAAAKAGTSIYNVGWASNALGSFYYAHDYRSFGIMPDHTDAGRNNLACDIYGNMVGVGRNAESLHTTRAKFQSSELRHRIHSEVSSITNNLLNLFDLFFIAEGLHSRGFTRVLPPRIEVDSKVIGEWANADRTRSPLNALSSLLAALKWHQASHTIGYAQSPILAYVPDMRRLTDYHSMIPIVDTFGLFVTDMRTKFLRKRFSSVDRSVLIEGSSSRNNILRFWFSNVLPHIPYSSFAGFRFVSRKDLEPTQIGQPYEGEELQ